MTTPTLPQLLAIEPDLMYWGGIGGFAVLLFLFVAIFLIKQYKRCPSNRILVIYGKVGGKQASKCIHGGSALVIPLIQDFDYLSLEPLVIDIPLEGALSLNNIRVNVPSTFTVGIGTGAVLMNNAAERLLGLDDKKIRDQAQDIILGQLRLVIATLSIEEINKDREKFMNLINENVGQEVNKIGLDLINVNIRDITDESGYIDAIGKRAAAEAVNQAKVDVSQQDRDGDTGVATAQRERAISVAREEAQAAEGRKGAEQSQRVAVATLEAQAIEGENEAAARRADSDAVLAEVRAEAKRRSEVAQAQAEQKVLVAEREQKLAELGKTELAPAEIEKQRVEIAAEAEAERSRRIAAGEADAIMARYHAEATGLREVLSAKAAGYREIMQACAADPRLAPALLMIEKLPELVGLQVQAIRDLKIDKITVWDSGRGGDGSGRGSTADFLSGLMGSLPAMHELAAQAGIELPGALGRVPGLDEATREADDDGGERPLRADRRDAAVAVLDEDEPPSRPSVDD